MIYLDEHRKLMRCIMARVKERTHLVEDGATTWGCIDKVSDIIYRPLTNFLRRSVREQIEGELRK